jgi:hypothetical protein
VSEGDDGRVGNFDSPAVSFDELAYSGEEPGSAVLGEETTVGLCGEQVDEAVSGEGRCPQIAPDAHVVEEPEGGDLVAQLIVSGWWREPREAGLLGLEFGRDAGVKPVELAMEVLALPSGPVPHQRECSARFQGLGCPPVADVGSHPVPRLRGELQTESVGFHQPVLERRNLDSDVRERRTVAPGDRGHWLEGDDVGAPSGERHRRLARARPDLQHRNR